VARGIELKNQMAKARDETRNLISDLNDIVESWEGGLESIELGFRDLDSGIDHLSQYV
jgi:hypothetical protein